jgi:hypothetical protein
VRSGGLHPLQDREPGCGRDQWRRRRKALSSMAPLVREGQRTRDPRCGGTHLARLAHASAISRAGCSAIRNSWASLSPVIVHRRAGTLLGRFQYGQFSPHAATGPQIHTHTWGRSRPHQRRPPPISSTPSQATLRNTCGLNAAPTPPPRPGSSRCRRPAEPRSVPFPQVREASTTADADTVELASSGFDPLGRSPESEPLRGVFAGQRPP